MEIKQALVLEGNEPLSKALNSVLDTGTAVIISKNGKYQGIIDDRNFRFGGGNPTKVKCETVVVKPPVIRQDATLWERTEAFLMGRFKALPVVDERNKPLGIITRAEILEELLALRLIPKIAIKGLMSSPVYTIEENSKVADAKSRMKDYGAKRLVVLRRGTPVGVFSTLDLACIALRPRVKERMGIVLPETLSADDQPIAKYYRPDVATIDEKSSVDEAVQGMIKKDVSHLVVLSKGKPVGILSAVDIFRWIKNEAGEGTTIEISGLDEDTKRFYGDIKKEVDEAVAKFAGTFGILSVTVHVKETKSFYSLKMHVNGKERFVVSADAPTIREAVDIAVAELKKILSRKKGKEKSRKSKSIKRGGFL